MSKTFIMTVVGIQGHNVHKVKSELYLLLSSVIIEIRHAIVKVRVSRDKFVANFNQQDSSFQCRQHHVRNITHNW